METINELKIYEKDGVELGDLSADKLILRTPIFNKLGWVLVDVGAHSYRVASKEVINAVENCENTAKA